MTILPTIDDVDYCSRQVLLPQPTYGLMINDQNTYSDTRLDDRIKESCKTQPLDWHYRTKKVTYNLNKDFYRCPEWELINWTESIVLFGCSFAYCIGVPDDETIAFYLENLLGRPVVNLGLPGTGPLYAFQNQVIARNIFPLPHAVVNMWSCPYRIHEFIDSTSPAHYSVGHDSRLSFPAAWGKSIMNPVMHSYFGIKAAESLWSSTKYVSTSTWLPIDRNTVHLADCNLDYAADLAHFGPVSNRMLAERLAELIKI